MAVMVRVLVWNVSLQIVFITAAVYSYRVFDFSLPCNW